MADGLSIAASVAGLVALADTVFRGVYKYYKTVADAGDEIQELARQVQALAGLLHSLNILVDALDQDGSQGAIQMSHISDTSKILGEIQSRLSKASSRLAGTKVRLVTESLKWPFTKSRTKELSEKLSAQYQIINMALNADSLSKLMELLSASRDLKEQISSIQHDVKDLKDLTRVKLDNDRQRILDFFLKVNPQPHLDTSIRLRHPGTGTWLLDSIQFRQWLETEGAKIWLSGIPGAGKTVIAGAVVQKALERGKSNANVGVAFFFCDYKDPKTASSTNILCTMASQLARQSDEAFNALQSVYEKLHPQDGLPRDPNPDVSRDCLEELIKCFDQVILVVDGLDECGDNVNEVTQTLVEIAEYADNATISLSSREEYDIESKLRGSFEQVQVGAQKEDLLLYVASEIESRVKDGRLRIVDMTLKDDVLSQLANKAQGMFRWVTCQLDYLGQCVTDFDRREALKQLPPTLDKTYERMLTRINAAHPRARQIVQRCLQLVASDWGLPIEELCHAISVSDTPNATLHKYAIVTEQEVSRQCSSFIRKSEDGQHFEFSHFSVREFFGREALKSNSEFAPYYISNASCKAVLAKQSLLYLQLQNFSRTPVMDLVEERQYETRRSKQFPFYQTAVIAWLGSVGDADDAAVWDLAKLLFDPQKSSPYFASWVVALHREYAWYNMNASKHASILRLVLDRRFNQLHVAALLGLSTIGDRLLHLYPAINIVSPAGSVLECAISSVFCLPGCDSLEGREATYTKSIFNTFRRARICSADFLLSLQRASDRPLKGSIANLPLMAHAISCAYAFLDFAPLAYLVEAGWVVSEQDAAKFDQYTTRITQEIETYHLSSHESGDVVPHSLHELVICLNRNKTWQTGAGLVLCIAAWNLAIDLQYDFSKDTSLMDTRVTLSSEALISLCHVAIDNEDTETMETCLSDGRISGPEGDDDGTDTSGYSLVRRAVARRSTKVVRLLISRGYKVTKSSPEGLLPIHEAWNSELEMLQLLFESGSSHSGRDSKGNTIWHLAAAKFEHVTIAALLQLAGVHEALWTENEDGFTPLTLSIQRMASDVSSESLNLADATRTIDLLLSSCPGNSHCWACPGSIWDLVVKSNSASIVKALADSKIPMDFPQGQPSPLHSIHPSYTTTEFVRELKVAFPNATSTLHNGHYPLETFVFQSLRLSQCPSGVLEELFDSEILAANEHKMLTVWECICRSLMDPEVVTRRTEDNHIFFNNLYKIIEVLLRFDVPKAHEDLLNTSAAIPWLKTVMGGPPSLLDQLSSSGLWKSACVTSDMIEFVKAAIRSVSEYGSEEAASDVQHLVINGVDIHQLSNGYSILQIACLELRCAGSESIVEDSPAGHTSPTTGPVERRVLTCILDAVKLEKLNEADQDGGLLHLLIIRLSDKELAWKVKALAHRGVDIDTVRYSIPLSGTPLTHSLWARKPIASETLLDLGADIAARDPAHSDASLAAAGTGNYEFLTLLLQRVRRESLEFSWTSTISWYFMFDDMYTETFHGMNALHLASWSGQIACLDFYLENNLISDPRSTTPTGHSCLHFAALGGHSRMIRYLHSLGLDVNQVSNNGTLPLYLAVQGGHHDAVVLLTELGSASTHDSAKMTPVMYAKNFKSKSIVEYFDQKAPDNQHRAHLVSARVQAVSLVAAIARDDVAACRSLYNRGCSLNTRLPDCDICTPLVRAIGTEKKAIITWLLENKVSTLSSACQKHDMGSIVELAAARPNLNSILPRIIESVLDDAWDFDKSFGNAALACVRSENEEGLEILLDHCRSHSEAYSALMGLPTERVVFGIVNYRSLNVGRGYPLHEAARSGQLTTLRLLLDAGAEADALDSYNLTAIEWAETPEALALLFEAGTPKSWIDSNTWAQILDSWHYIGLDSHAAAYGIGLSRLRLNSRNLPGDLDGYYIQPADTDRLSLTSNVLSLLIHNQVDVNSTHHGQLSVIHSALCDQKSASFLLSLPELIESKPFPWHAYGRVIQTQIWLTKRWRLFRKRIPFAKLQHILNLQPKQGISPLCQAAAVDALDVIDHCLEMGAEIDFEGSSFGSALLAACANHRLKAVKHLVRKGASTVCNGLSAFDMAAGHRKIEHFLLVGRFTEQPRLTAKGSDSVCSDIKPWSGIQQKSMPLKGYYERRSHWSLLDYIIYLADVRKKLRGRALPFHKFDHLAELPNLVYYQI